MDATAPTAEALDLAVHRIRRVSRPDAPYAATRGALGGDETVLLVDTDALDGWLGWGCTGAQHLLAPLDVVRHAGGHEAVLPDVRERVARACGEREAAGAGWRRGEAVTLLVSLLRGVAEAAAASATDGEGEWWIAADGRPVFAFASGSGETIAAASRVLVDRVAAQIDDRVLARAIDDVRTALDQPDALGPRLDDLEEPLFDAAAPQPIQSAARGALGEARSGRSIATDTSEAEGRFAWLRDAIDRHVDSSLGEMIRGAAASVGERVAAHRERARARGAAAQRASGASEAKRPAKPARSRGGMRGDRRAKGARWPLLVVGSGAAVLVVALGMLWPAGAPDARAREEVVASSSPTASPTASPAAEPAEVPSDEPSPAAEPPPDPGTAEDPVAAARELLGEWDDCGEACGAPDGVERGGAVADAARDLALVDDYGAVALIQVSAPERRPQLLVVERRDDRWLVRDLYAAPE